MTAPTDTSKTDPLLLLVGAMAEGSSNFIENMEAEGQRQVLESTSLPVDRNRWSDEGEQRWLDLGFTFGEVVDDMFQEATLPEGWKREGSDHSMWSYIVDERGLRRVGIFYKAAFYDRSAHMDLLNPGSEASSKFVYEDGYEVPWDLFTEGERADYVKGLHAQLGNCEEYPDIYDKDGQADSLRAEITKRTASA